MWLDNNFYAGGGSGAGVNGVGWGVVGGGGQGGKSGVVSASAGTANTGGGGGGGYATSGAAGGSGIVVIRYLGVQKATGGNTIVTKGGYTYHYFTSSGTFTA
jgi:hypothetical protein